jgi:hypothetical protein
MSKIFKHKKIKNTGLLYELLIRQMTSDVLKGDNPLSFKFFKKYFKDGSPLRKELNLYNTLYNHKDKNPDFAIKMVDAVIKEHSQLDINHLNKDKYNLIKEINKNFNKDLFMKTQIDNYKLYASIYNLFENRESDNPSLYLKNKLYIVNYITNNTLDTATDKQDFMESVDPELKSLTFKLLTEKFNNKWSSNLDNNQKEILRHFIFNSVDNEDTKSFINEHINNIENKLNLNISNLEDKVLKIKLEEVLSILPKLKESNFITESHYLSLIRYYELIREL